MSAVRDRYFSLGPLFFSGFSISTVAFFMAALLNISACSFGGKYPIKPIMEKPKTVSEYTGRSNEIDSEFSVISLLRELKAPHFRLQSVSVTGVVDSLFDRMEGSLPVSFIIKNSQATDTEHDFESTGKTIAETLDKICEIWGVRWRIASYTVIIE